jgi:methionyl-tRNA synthetase
MPQPALPSRAKLALNKLPRIEDAQINQVIESSKQSMQTTEKETQEDDMIQIDDFTKIDLRIAKIVKEEILHYLQPAPYPVRCQISSFLVLN